MCILSAGLVQSSWENLSKWEFLGFFPFRLGKGEVCLKQPLPDVSAVLILALLEMSSKKHASSLQKCFHWSSFLIVAEDSRRFLFFSNCCFFSLSFRGRPEGNTWFEWAWILYPGSHCKFTKSMCITLFVQNSLCWFKQSVLSTVWSLVLLVNATQKLFINKIQKLVLEVVYFAVPVYSPWLYLIKKTFAGIATIANFACINLAFFEARTRL